MSIVWRIILAGALVTLPGTVLAGCASDASPAPLTAAGVATPCSPARCGERPIAPRRKCADGSYAGVGACVQTGGRQCGWQVVDCPIGS